MVMAVGVVMGLHAAYEIFINGTEISGSILLTYLPVSLLYISSMTIGSFPGPSAGHFGHNSHGIIEAQNSECFLGRLKQDD